ncbi:DUF1292 domain-containing protein [bacterium]|nr:DUF1292 domain-containing protein [bacterium]
MAFDEENVIEITDDDGTVLRCELYDIIEYEGKSYALLLEENSADSEDPEVVLMKYVEEGEEVFFETIDDDEEFEKVQAYIETLEPVDEDEEE